jgi:DNA-binding sugar fermentation-stimulating protein
MTIERPTRPLTSLPARLDAAACLQILERIDPEFKTDSIEAARSSVDVAKVDFALSYTELSTSDRMNLKAALVRHGILARGRSVSIGRI